MVFNPAQPKIFLVRLFAFLIFIVRIASFRGPFEPFDPSMPKPIFLDLCLHNPSQVEILTEIFLR